MTRAYYSTSSAHLATAAPDAILGALARQLPFPVDPPQRAAWILEIAQMRALAVEFPEAHFFFEFAIPRMGRRVDVVILWRHVIYVIEYKVGESKHRCERTRSSDGIRAGS